MEFATVPYHMLRGGASPFAPELGIVAEWVGLEELAIAASPLRVGEGLCWGNGPVVDPGEVQGVGQQRSAWCEHLCNHHVCSILLQAAANVCQQVGVWQGQSLMH